MLSLDGMLENLVKLHGLGAEVNGLELLSSRGKILAAMLHHDGLNVKDIPSLSGVSCRACFEHLAFLEQLEIIEKTNDPLDKRRSIVKVNAINLHKILKNHKL